MKKYINGQYIEMNNEEIASIKAEAVKMQIAERQRPLTIEEVITLFIHQSVNTLKVDDNTALRMINFYPEWTTNISYTEDYKVKYNGKLWKAIQSHISQIGWEPDITTSLWEQINESHNGTINDPIPYDGNRALIDGLYYVQNYVIYLCTRDTINPIYNALADLTGIYVEVI